VESKTAASEIYAIGYVVGKADVTVRLISLTLYTEVASFVMGCDRCVHIYTDFFWRWNQRYIYEKTNYKHSMWRNKFWVLA
jgi:hypothetical protein